MFGGGREAVEAVRLIRLLERACEILGASPRMKAEVAARSIEVALDKILPSPGRLECSRLDEGPAAEASSTDAAFVSPSNTAVSQCRCI